MTEPSLPALPESLDGVDDLSSAAFRAFIGALRLHRRLMAQTLADHGFHPGQAMCLRLLTPADDVTQRDLARSLHVSSPTVTKMVDSMETRRAGAASSRRRRTPGSCRVELTDAGRVQEREMHAAAGEYVELTIGTLSERDRRELARLLEKLGDDRAGVELVADEPEQPR